MDNATDTANYHQINPRKPQECGGLGLLRTTLLVTLFITFLLVPGAYRTPFFSKGEAREALAGQSVYEAGEWILPHRYGSELIVKPPGTYWLMALASLPFSQVNELSARLPSIVLCTLTLIALLELTARHLSLRHGYITVAILLSSALWIRSSAVARVDMCLTGFLFGALITSYRWTEDNLSGFLWPCITVLCLTSATLIKGPVAILLYSGSMCSYCMLRGKRTTQTILTTSLLSCLSGACALTWYIAAYREGGERYIELFFLENFDRFHGTMAAQGRQPHEHGVGYLIGTLIVGFLPGSLALLWLPWKGYIKSIYDRRLLSRDTLRVPMAYLKNLPSLVLFSITTSIVLVLFFSFPASKRAEYLLPAYPFLAITMSYYYIAHNNFSGRLTEKILKTIAYCVTALYCLGILVLPIFVSLYKEDTGKFGNISNGLSALFRNIAGTGFLGLLLITVPFVLFFVGLSKIQKKDSRKGILILFGGYLTFVGALNNVIVPSFAVEASPKQFAKEIKQLVETGSPLYSANTLYDLNFYLKGQLSSALLEESPDSYFVLTVREFDKASSEQTQPTIILRSKQVFRSHQKQLVLFKTAVKP